MQLMTPTPMNALRQARSASPSSERRTPGTADINPELAKGGAPLKHEGTRGLILPIFIASVHRSGVNLNTHRPRLDAENGTKPRAGQPPRACRETQASKRGTAGMGGRLEEQPPQRLACRRRRLRKRHQDDGHRDTADLTAQVEQCAASDSNPGGSLPAGLRTNANPLAERLPE